MPDPTRCGDFTRRSPAGEFEIRRPAHPCGWSFAGVGWGAPLLRRSWLFNARPGVRRVCPTVPSNVGGILKRLFAPFVLLLFAAGCTAPGTAPTTTPATSPPADAGTASTESTPAPTALPAAKFTLNTQTGAKITVEFPTPATDPALETLEAFRKKTGGKPVSYVVADVDNRAGTEPVKMYQINAFDKEGREYTFGTVSEVLDTWKPTYRNDFEYKLPDGRIVDNATGSALSKEASELHDANLNGADVAKQAKIVLASIDVDLPDEFSRVSVHPSGSGQGEDATPIPG